MRKTRDTRTGRKQPLQLRREVLRVLQVEELADVAGGARCPWSRPPPGPSGLYAIDYNLVIK